MSKESYIVRIYRKDALPVQMSCSSGGRRQHDRVALTGIIEDAEHGGRFAYHDVEGLLAVLCGGVKQPTHNKG